jgi:branched-chain amino acid transport system substrate-binding protein
MTRPVRRTPALVVALAATAAAVVASWPPPSAPLATGAHQVEPYRRGHQAPLDFRGPGRDDPEPAVSEVVIGWFGPDDPAHPEFGSLWRGARLALEEENAGGGYCGPSGTRDAPARCKPFRLAPVWSEHPWHAGAVSLLRLVYDGQAWAVIGGVDGTTTHVAVQLALKSRFLLLSPGSTDVSTDRANVPWLFSLPPSDDAIAAAMADALASHDKEACAIVATTDHSTRATLSALRRELNRRRIVPAALVEIDSPVADAEAVTTRALRDRPAVVLVLASAPQAGVLVRGLREAGFAGPVLGGPTAAGHAFRLAAGSAAEGVLAPVSIEAGPRWDAFTDAYEQRWRAQPDEAAGNGYDAVKFVVAAIRRAGLNRSLVRDAVRELAPWDGAGGVTNWDLHGRNRRRVVLARWTAGRLVPADRQ